MQQYPRSLIRVIHDFTDEPSRLLAAVRRYRPAFSVAEAFGRNPATLAHRTLAGVDLLIQRLAGVPGRKNLIWIGTSFPGLEEREIEPGTRNPVLRRDRDDAEILVNPNGGFLQSNQSLIRATAGALAEANITVYPVEPSGLATGVRLLLPAVPKGAREPADQTELRSQMGTTDGGRIRSVAQEQEPAIAAMTIIAEETGGRATASSNNLASAFEAAFRDARSGYQLGFYPPAQALDNRYHSLLVRCRRPGVRLRYRRRYFAGVAPVLVSMPVKQALQTAAMMPMDTTAVGLSVSLTSAPLESGPQDVVLRLDVRDLQFTFEPYANRWVADADLVILRQDSKGRFGKGQRDSLHLALRPETYATALSDGLFLERTVVVSSHTAQVRFIVRDANTGRTGSVSVAARPIF